MRKMKKILSLVLVAMMVLSSSLMSTRVVFAEEGEGEEPEKQATFYFVNGEGNRIENSITPNAEEPTFIGVGDDWDAVTFTYDGGLYIPVDDDTREPIATKLPVGEYTFIRLPEGENGTVGIVSGSYNVRVLTNPANTDLHVSIEDADGGNPGGAEEGNPEEPEKQAMFYFVTGDDFPIRTQITPNTETKFMEVGNDWDEVTFTYDGGTYIPVDDETREPIATKLPAGEYTFIRLPEGESGTVGIVSGLYNVRVLTNPANTDLRVSIEDADGGNPGGPEEGNPGGIGDEGHLAELSAAVDQTLFQGVSLATWINGNVFINHFDTFEEAMDALNALSNNYEEAYVYVHKESPDDTSERSYSSSISIVDDPADNDLHSVTFNMNGDSAEFLQNVTVVNSHLVFLNAYNVSFYNCSAHVTTTSQGALRGSNRDSGVLEVKNCLDVSGKIVLQGMDAGQSVGSDNNWDGILVVQDSNITAAEVESSFGCVVLQGGSLWNNFKVYKTFFDLKSGEFHGNVTENNDGQETSHFRFYNVYIYSFDPAELPFNRFNDKERTSLIPVMGEEEEHILAKHFRADLIDASDSHTIMTIENPAPNYQMQSEEAGLTFASIRDSFGQTYFYNGMDNEGNALFSTEGGNGASVTIPYGNLFGFVETTPSTIKMIFGEGMVVTAWHDEMPQAPYQSGIFIDKPDLNHVTTASSMTIKGKNEQYYVPVDEEGNLLSGAQVYEGEYVLQSVNSMEEARFTIPGYIIPYGVLMGVYTEGDHLVLRLRYASDDIVCTHKKATWDNGNCYCIDCGKAMLCSVTVDEDESFFETIEDAFDYISSVDCDMFVALEIYGEGTATVSKPIIFVNPGATDEKYFILNLNGITLECTEGITLQDFSLKIEGGTVISDISVIGTTCGDNPYFAAANVELQRTSIEGTLELTGNPNMDPDHFEDVAGRVSVGLDDSVVENIVAHGAYLLAYSESRICGDIQTEGTILDFDDCVFEGNLSEIQGGEHNEFWFGKLKSYRWDPTEYVRVNNLVQTGSDEQGDYWLVGWKSFTAFNAEGEVVVEKITIGDSIESDPDSMMEIQYLVSDGGIVYHVSGINTDADPGQVSYRFTEDGNGSAVQIPSGNAFFVYMVETAEGSELILTYSKAFVATLEYQGETEEIILDLFEGGFNMGTGAWAWDGPIVMTIRNGNQYYAPVDDENNLFDDHKMLQGMYRLIPVEMEHREFCIGGRGFDMRITEVDDDLQMNLNYWEAFRHEAIGCPEFVDRFDGICTICGQSYECYIEERNVDPTGEEIRNYLYYTKVEDGIHILFTDKKQTNSSLTIYGTGKEYHIPSYSVIGMDDQQETELRINLNGNSLYVDGDEENAGILHIENIELGLQDGTVYAKGEIVTSTMKPESYGERGCINLRDVTWNGDMDLQGRLVGDQAGWSGTNAYLDLYSHSVVNGDVTSYAGQFTFYGASALKGNCEIQRSGANIWYGVVDGELTVPEGDDGWFDINYAVFSVWNPTIFTDLNRYIVVTKEIDGETMWIVRPVEYESVLDEGMVDAIYNALFSSLITIKNPTVTSVMETSNSLSGAQLNAVAEVIAQKENVVTIGKGVSGQDPVETMVSSATATLEEAVASLVEEVDSLYFDDDGLVFTNGGSIQVVQEVQMNITLKDVEASEESGTFTVGGLVYDIDPVVVTRATFNDGMTEKELTLTEDLTVLNQSITISLVIPSALAVSDENGGYKPVRVAHNHDGYIYYYQATVSEELRDGNTVYVATFTDYIGFSDFELSTNETEILLIIGEDEDGNPVIVSANELGTLYLENAGEAFPLNLTTESILDPDHSDTEDDIVFEIDAVNATPPVDEDGNVILGQDGTPISVIEVIDGESMIVGNVNGEAVITIIAYRDGEVISVAQLNVVVGKASPDDDDPDDSGDSGDSDGDDFGNTPGGDDSGDNSGTPGGDNSGSGDNSNTGNDSGNGNNTGNNNSNGGTDSGSNNNSSSSNGNGENSGANNSGSDNNGSNDSKPTEENSGTNNGSTSEDSSNGTNNTTTNNSKTPDTGDRNNMTVWVMCLLISMVGMVIAVKYGKKKTN